MVQVLTKAERTSAEQGWRERSNASWARRASRGPWRPLERRAGASGSEGENHLVHESALRPGDPVTVRKGAVTLPESRSSRKLTVDIRGRVVRVDGRSVQVEVEHACTDGEGLSLAGKLLTFDRSYIYGRDGV